MARHQGIPVRARVGFATYFSPGFHTDHEVVEWWDAGEQRWKLLDPELSDRHVAHFKIGFDPFDVPRDAFLVGGRAWQVCRSGEADADMFGLDPRAPQPRGMRFVRGHVVQDLAALNKVELLLWDIWGLMDAPPDTAVSLLDDVAERTLAGDSLTDLQRLYALPGLAVPPRVQCLSPARGPHEAVVV